MVDPYQPTPYYLQIAEALEQRIRSGELAPGQVVPSETTLMQEYGVSRPTVRNAVAELRKRGLVITAHGRGTYVRPDD